MTAIASLQPLSVPLQGIRLIEASAGGGSGMTAIASLQPLSVPLQGIRLIEASLPEDQA